MRTIEEMKEIIDIKIFFTVYSFFFEIFKKNFEDIGFYEYWVFRSSRTKQKETFYGKAFMPNEFFIEYFLNN